MSSKSLTALANMAYYLDKHNIDPETTRLTLAEYFSGIRISDSQIPRNNSYASSDVNGVNFDVPASWDNIIDPGRSQEIMNKYDDGSHELNADADELLQSILDRKKKRDMISENTQATETLPELPVIQHPESHFIEPHAADELGTLHAPKAFKISDIF